MKALLEIVELGAMDVVTASSTPCGEEEICLGDGQCPCPEDGD